MNEKLRNILVRQSETREALNDIISQDTPDESKLTELRTKAQAIEVELREALKASDSSDDDRNDGGKSAPDAETRERLELRNKAKLSTYIGKALTGETCDGAEAEFSAACGCPGAMPISMLESETREVETRAITPGPDVPAGTQRAVPYVFERTVAAMLGVTFPSVETGIKNFPVLESAPPTGLKGKDAAADSTASSFALNTRSPKRLTGQFIVRREDLATLDGMEESLRMAITESASDALDAQVFTGNGTAPNLNGLFKVATDVSAASAVETFATGVGRFAGVVDGRYANSMADLRAVIGVSTYKLYAGLFNSGGVSLVDYLSDKLGALVVSKRVPAVASMAQRGLVMRQRGSQIAEVPVWQGISLIRDEFTKAAEGQIVVTAVMLVSDPHLPFGVQTAIEIHPKLSS